LKSVAAIYSYSKSKGLFAGVSIEGSVIVERKDANEAFYRQKVSAAQLLSGAITPPPQADILYRALNSKASGGGVYGINRGAGSGSFGNDYENNSSSSVGRSASTVSAGRYGGGGYASRAASNATTVVNSSRDYHSEDKAREAESDALPRYTPSAASARKPVIGAGRVSTDNSGFPASTNHNIANSTGPRVPPRIGAKPDVVTALYDFAGEQATDLSFKKGDVITVVKKTESRDDWWTGRVGAREGSFPANYTQ